MLLRGRGEGYERSGMPGFEQWYSHGPFLMTTGQQQRWRARAKIRTTPHPFQVESSATPSTTGTSTMCLWGKDRRWWLRRRWTWLPKKVTGSSYRYDLCPLFGVILGPTAGAHRAISGLLCPLRPSPLPFLPHPCPSHCLILSPSLLWGPPHCSSRLLVSCLSKAPAPLFPFGASSRSRYPAEDHGNGVWFTS